MFKSLKDIISNNPGQSSKVQRHYKNQDSFDFFQLIKNWQDIVGEQLACHTYPMKIRNKSLIILTKHAIYSQELSFLSEDIKKKIFKKYPTLRTHIERLQYVASNTFFLELEQKQEVKFEEEEEKRHRYDPQYREKLAQAQKKFADIEDEELREIIISLSLKS